MVTLKEYEAYLKVKRFIDGHDEAEIISRLMGDNKYVPLIIESDGTNPIKYYSTSAAAKHRDSKMGLLVQITTFTTFVACQRSR